MIIISEKTLILTPSKTASISIVVGLLKKYLGDEWLAGRPMSDLWADPLVQLFGLWNWGNHNSNHHWTYHDWVVMYPPVSSFRVVTTVRHPLTRMESEFRYQLGGNRHNGRYTHEDFNESIISGELFENCFKYHDRTQTDYLPENAELIRFERLKEDAEKVLGIKNLPHVKHTQKPFITPVSEDANEILVEKFGVDYERLGYCP